MSDAENQTKEVSAAPAAGGFTPEPAPPQVDASEVKNILEDEATDDDAHGVQVPHETAKKALEAVQILVENNRAASQQLESLMGIVLDAAEVANRSASAVSTTGGQLNKAAEKLVDGAGKTAFQAKVVLALAASVLVGTAGTFSFMTVQLNNKVEQVDAMLLAVGKRAVDLKTRLESLDKMNATLDDINLKQDSSQTVQQAIEDKLTAAVEAVRAAPKPAPVAAPAPVKTAAPKPEGKSLNQQFAAIDALLKEQSQAVKNLSGQVNNVQASVANVDSLKRDVETMTNLQRQRAQEAAQATLAANAKREKEQKDKERELIRERDQAKERELIREREHAKEREQAKERELARERDREKNRAVQYSREQSNPNGSTASNGLPSYTRQGGTEADK
jgi:hypothetical protein